MPQMTASQLKALAASSGAYSVVTEREATRDRSITVDSYEKIALFTKYPKSVFTRKGGAPADGKPDRHLFQVHPKNSFVITATQSLAIYHPKLKGGELRAYMSEPAAFSGAADGEIFYIFIRDFDPHPHIGFMTSAIWDTFWVNPTPLAIAAIAAAGSDDEDEEFQRSIDAAAAKVPVETSGMRYPRDPNVAWKAIKYAGFTCEINPLHNTFVSAATGHNYVEAHHLVPMSAQPNFVNTLDVKENIVAMCPGCHRHIHLGDPNTRIQALLELHAKRQAGLARRGVNVDVAELLKCYNLA